MRFDLLFISLILLLSLRIGTAESQEYHRGPIGIADPFPLGIVAPSFVPDTTETIAPKSFQLSSNLSWSNTINRKGSSFIIDSETRVWRNSLRVAPLDGWELGVELPVVWRGGGVFDDPIYTWHETFHLAQGPRDDRDVEDNEFRIEGRTKDGQSFDIRRNGTGFGDVKLFSKVKLSDQSATRPAFSAMASLQLPSGTDTYGLEGPGVTGGLLASKRWKIFGLYSGLSYTYLSNTQYEEIRYRKHRTEGFLSLEAAFRVMSGFLQLTAASSLIDNIERFPDYQVYFDSGFAISLGSFCDVQFLIRENPAPDHGTADFTVFVGLVK